MCVMNKRYICTFQSATSEFRVFDAATKGLIGQFTKPVANFGVSTFALSRRADTLAFTQGKVIYLKDLSTLKTNADFVQVKRDMKLCALAVSDDGLSVAAGDDSGKIYYVTNP